MGEMKGVGRIKIHPGKLDGYKRLAHRCIDIVRECDTGTLQYEIVINDDAMAALVFERFKGSDAGLSHAENIAEISRELAEISDVSGEVWGDRSPELRDVPRSAGVTSRKRTAGGTTRASRLLWCFGKTGCPTHLDHLERRRGGAVASR